MIAHPPERIVSLPPLHPGQQAVADAYFARQFRFGILACGRRWGKTVVGAAIALGAALRGQHVWWLGPSYRVAQVGWREIRTMATLCGFTAHEAARRVDHATCRGWVEVRSADEPNLLRGEGLDLVVLDECAYIAERVWTEVLRPALADRQGRALFVSTPRGQNWFWRLYQLAEQHPALYRAWRFPTSTNPYIPASELEAARLELPARVYAQEFEAEFLADGGIFRNVLACATAEPQTDPQPGHQYAIGVDWGKYQDWTVFAVLDLTDRALVHLDRMQQVDYTLQRARLQALAARFRPVTIVAERNAMGEPIIEELQRAGLPIQPYLVSAATKAGLLDALALAFEQQHLRILDEPVLLGELQGYQAERLPSGLLRYGAPAGLHDDCVMALALAWQAAQQSAGTLPPLIHALRR